MSLISVINFNVGLVFTTWCYALCVKCGIAIACRLSVCLSVTLVDQDHIGWKSWKLYNCTHVQLAQHIRYSSIHVIPGEHGEILGRLEVGWEKVACWRTKSLKRVKIEEKLLWRAYRNSIINALLNGTISDPLATVS